MLERLVVKGLLGPESNLDALAWQPFRTGVEIHRLYGDGESGPAAALLRYAPGASVPPHEHTGTEHILVLRGSQRDATALYPVGTCVIHGQGTHHVVSSDEGCVVLAIWSAPVRFSTDP
jgi:anti-sigma factor ChrR (cupin superfamily)